MLFKVSSFCHSESVSYFSSCEIIPLICFHFCINHLVICVSFIKLWMFQFLHHNRVSVLHWNASILTQTKLDQFSCFPLFSSILSFHPNILPFILVCQSNKFSQGAFRQNTITHVTTGAKSEHRGQQDASMLEMYSKGFIVIYFIWGNATPVELGCLAGGGHVYSTVKDSALQSQSVRARDSKRLHFWIILNELAVILSLNFPSPPHWSWQMAVPKPVPPEVSSC